MPDKRWGGGEWAPMELIETLKGDIEEAKFTNGDSDENVESWGKPVVEQLYGSREGTSDFRLQTSDFRLQTSDFRLQTSDFRLQTSDFRLSQTLVPSFANSQHCFCEAG